jgi:hypothetical protein
MGRNHDRPLDVVERFDARIVFCHQFSRETLVCPMVILVY